MLFEDRVQPNSQLVRDAEPDDAAFCRRVSEALALGYELYGSPAVTFNGKDVIVAQAIIWPSRIKP